MRHSPAVNLALIAHLFESKTRRELADYLGVSTRTIRRWFNEGKQPSKQHSKTITKKAGQIRSAATRAIKKASQPPLPRFSFPPFIQQRQRKDGGTDIYYDVSLNSHDEIVQILEGLSTRRNAIFITYRVFSNKKNYGEYKTKGPIAINDFDGEEEISDLLDAIEAEYEGADGTGELNHVLDIRVTDYLVR